jgi:hypothetical protein
MSDKMDLHLSLLFLHPLSSASLSSIHSPSTGTAALAMSLALAHRPSNLDVRSMLLFPPHECLVLSLFKNDLGILWLS